MKFTNQQYQTIINALLIAGMVHWVVGEVKTGEPENQPQQLHEVIVYMLHFAAEHDFENCVDKIDGKIMVNRKYFEQAMSELDEYEEFIFWQNLARKLAERDFYRIFTQEQIKKMDQIKWMESRMALELAYFNEFKDHRLERLEVQKEFFSENKKVGQE